ncbi:MAG: hypothetical protein N4J56_003448 [Chroococcidiopsis sp. SAG 2025]|uniref:hypothetical protein n=1 Tax=Chroococcidiopsis sp. SAG 2025 TaxID=171389 RepID=UPI00293745C3|nr:hypothetical protein [Chroococcidiopsis sp. SAG 2025]MDV2993794.1 hypothetical protein [Chroococcidiopsis sp. SAG 2025]
MQVVTLPLEPKFDTSQGIALNDLAQIWQWQLAFDYPNFSTATKESIVCWLLGNRAERLDSEQFKLAQQGIAYRYRILQNRYLGQSPEQGYRRLLTRLGSLVVLQNKIRMTIALGRDRRCQISEVLQEFLQDLLQRDCYLQQQITAIAECTDDLRLRNALLFTAIEEYCLRPVRNQPLIVYRFINYMRRYAPGGVTQVPNNSEIRIVFAQIPTEDSDRSFNLLDVQAIGQYKEQEEAAEQQSERDEVKQQLSQYLEQKLGHSAVQWLNLYLQGQSQQAIASQLNLTAKDVYRLREKVCYHATRLFQKGNRKQETEDWRIQN